MYTAGEAVAAAFVLNRGDKHTHEGAKAEGDDGEG